MFHALQPRSSCSFTIADGFVRLFGREHLSLCRTKQKCFSWWKKPSKKTCSHIQTADMSCIAQNIPTLPMFSHPRSRDLEDPGLDAFQKGHLLGFRTALGDAFCSILREGYTSLKTSCHNTVAMQVHSFKYIILHDVFHETSPFWAYAYTSLCGGSKGLARDYADKPLMRSGVQPQVQTS